MSGEGHINGSSIVDTAILLAEEAGWRNVRLRAVADRLGVSMAEVAARYRDLDAVADAWFERARQAMLAPPPDGFDTMPPPERLHLLLMRWFDALAPHRAVTGQMLGEKLYLSHPHHWVPMIFNLSRLVNWLRDAARLDATGRRRQMEEIGLTMLFLATLAVWRHDESAGQADTRACLRRQLARADRRMGWLWGGAPAAKRP
ncbi:MAG: TetR/AcrR family transcriptional regulator [Alphaproteobacteria bacterium]|nr:TetR/AcrR family transcriptional regulator [Alphaproteobacteria bacterium]